MLVLIVLVDWRSPGEQSNGTVEQLELLGLGRLLEILLNYFGICSQNAFDLA